MWPLDPPDPTAAAEAEEAEVKLPMEVQEWEDQPAADKLTLLLTHLRQYHCHCLFCAVQVRTASIMGLKRLFGRELEDGGRGAKGKGLYNVTCLCTGAAAAKLAGVPTLACNCAWSECFVRWKGFKAHWMIGADAQAPKLPHPMCTCMLKELISHESLACSDTLEVCPQKYVRSLTAADPELVWATAVQRRPGDAELVPRRDRRGPLS